MNFDWAGPGIGAHVTELRLLVIAAVCLLVSLAFAGFATWRHRRNLVRVPLRIHVAGTRGKSTVTRLIAAGLRAGDMRVLAKTTGSQARLILPDGREEDWRRRGPASIGEQTRFMARAAAMRVDAVVVECMAVRADLVWASENYLIRATDAVLTNSRPDHFEDNGADLNAAERALWNVTPPGRRMFVSAEAATAGLRAHAEGLGANLVVTPVDEDDYAAANRELALTVCEALGVARTLAAPAMEKAADDPGAYFAMRIVAGRKDLEIASAFACNDVQSLERLWRREHGSGAAAVLLNARADRPLRSLAFLRFIAGLANAPRVFVVGDPLAMRLARRAGLPAARLHRVKARAPAAVLTEIAADLATGDKVWGIGNYHGFGESCVAFLRQQMTPC